MILNENYKFKNRTLHIKWNEKQDIGEGKQDIRDESSIKDYVMMSDFSNKTRQNILTLYELYKDGTVFGRTDVMSAINITPSPASELIQKMLSKGIIMPVKGLGKGKYRFKLGERIL